MSVGGKAWVSSCCYGPLTAAGDVTQYYVCATCERACDAARLDGSPVSPDLEQRVAAPEETVAALLRMDPERVAAIEMSLSRRAQIGAFRDSGLPPS